MLKNLMASLLLFAALVAPALGQTAPTFFGQHIQSLSTPWPTIGFGAVRMYSNISGSITRWAQMNPSQNNYHFDNLDAWLMKFHSHGINNVVYTFSQVPQWASSVPTDTTCDFAQTGFNGGCDLPTDIKLDGTGTDATFIAFVTALATHVKNLDPNTYAHIEYWEPWNEVYRNNIAQDDYSWTKISLNATYAQMVRLTEDLRCTLIGSLPNGTCTSPPIDPNAKILSPSDGGQPCCGSERVFRNFLYCDDAPIMSSDCTTGSLGSALVDIINTHFYEAGGLSPENLAVNVNQFKGYLSSSDSLKPFWSDEGSWGSDSSVPDPDIEASWVARYYLIGLSSGLAEMYWYAYDSPPTTGYGTLWTGSALNKAGVAYGQVYNWIVGSTLTTPCSANGTIWTCGSTLGNTHPAEAIWDTSKTCMNGTCNTSPQNVPPTYNCYLDLAGVSHSYTGTQVPVGIKPILLTVCSGG